ncbi:hypothetical protein PENTCL1PPCAC_18916, partial [Pristionchus entomophagus]
MRGVNKRLYGIEEGMKKPLEYREELEIYVIISQGPQSNFVFSIGSRKEKVSTSQAISLIHRFASIFKFGTIVFAPPQKEQLGLLDNFNGITTDNFEIPEWVQFLIDRSIICKLMQISGVVKILRNCVPITVEDLKHIYEV